jgi:type I restriction enzyme S subunit
MASDWATSPLGELLSELLDHRGRNPKFAEDGVRAISGKNMRDGRLDLGINKRYVTAETWNEWMPKKLSTGDVLLTSEAPLGQVAYLSDEARYCLGQRLFGLRCDPEKLIGRFLYFALRSPQIQARLEHRASGTTAQGIRQSELVKVPLDYPSVAEQRRIVWVLGSLDDKIELNRMTARTLEEISAAIFKSWFVDFAAAEGFEDSEVGPIPKGWTVRTLGDFTSVVKGRSYKSEDLAPGTTALVTLKSFHRGGGYNPAGAKAYTGDYRADQVVLPGEIVLAHTDLTQARDVIGRPAIVRKTDPFTRLVASLDVAIVRPMNGVLSNEYLYGLLSTNRFRDHAFAHSNGSTVLHLNSRATGQFRFALPPPEMLLEYQSVAQPLHSRGEALERESVSLTALRDELLPKLISGRIRVPEGVGPDADDEEVMGELAASLAEHDDEGVAADTTSVG